MKRPIRLRGINGDVEGKVWESDSLLRAGRLGTLEIVLDDTSVSRRHAEVRADRPAAGASATWAAPTAPSSTASAWAPANGRSAPRDIVQFGNVALVVDAPRRTASDDEHQPPGQPAASRPPPATRGKTPSAAWPSTATAARGPASSCWPCCGPAITWSTSRSEDDLLHSILNDAVSVLDAQRGAIVLADGPDGPLQLRALATGHSQSRRAGSGFSQNLAQRCFSRGESILCRSVEEDPELALRPAASPTGPWPRCCACCCARRASSWACCTSTAAPGRSRSPRTTCTWPTPWPPTSPPASRAPSCSASSASCSCDTITILAQAVELRDEYTGGHTAPRHRLLAAAGPAARTCRPRTCELIRIGTPLHDIGKIGIDDAILRKPGKLTPEEFEIMKTHTVKGAEILETDPRPAAGHPDRPLAPRALGRQGLSRRPGGRGRSRCWPASWPWPTPSTP